ncbi:MAG: SlyX protein [Paracoccaceae bacterium]|jgi:SlyX protein
MDTTILEEKISHITKTLDELSDVVAHQDSRINKMVIHLERLMKLVTEQGEQDSGGIYLTDSKPPHY